MVEHILSTLKNNLLNILVNKVHINMRHRIKAGRVGSFTPDKQKSEVELLREY